METETHVGDAELRSMAVQVVDFKATILIKQSSKDPRDARIKCVEFASRGNLAAEMKAEGYTEGPIMDQSSHLFLSDQQTLQISFSTGGSIDFIDRKPKRIMFNRGRGSHTLNCMFVPIGKQSHKYDYKAEMKAGNGDANEVNIQGVTELTYVITLPKVRSSNRSQPMPTQVTSLIHISAVNLEIKRLFEF